MTVVRGERTRLLYKTENSFGYESGSTGGGAALTWRRFGITHGAICPDPDYQYEPQWIAGEGRDWKFMPGDAKEVYAGSIPDVWVQQAQIFKYILGGCVSAGAGAENVMTVANTLPSFTWEVSDWDETADGTVSSTGKVLMRRYLGCKVNRASLVCEEGGRMQLSLEEILCQNVLHDDTGYKLYTNYPTRYCSPFTSNHVDPYAYQPYLFHEGVLSLFGVEFAQVKRVNLVMSNGLEPQYFIQRGTTEPYPYSIVEHRTGFACTATINVTGLDLWRALMMKGKGTFATPSGIYNGFMGYLNFYRAGSSTDYIKIQLGPDTPTVINPGCFLKKAPTKSVDTPLIPIDVEVEVPTITIKSMDTYGTYNT
jgi:hypothetical protein